MAYDWIEVNPFAEDIPASYLAMHPFKRVPALTHAGFVLYETGAITRYVDEAFEGPKLQPVEPRERARCNQIMSIVDSYAYWPLVRQVFSHGFFRPRMSRPVDESEFQRGLEAAPRVLAALERTAGEGPCLCGNQLSLADIHLAPMVGYFVLADEGRALLQKYPRAQRMVVGTLQQIRVHRDNAAIAASPAVTIIASVGAAGLRIDERAHASFPAMRDCRTDRA